MPERQMEGGGGIITLSARRTDLSENGLSGAHSRSGRFLSHSVPVVAFSVNIFENWARANTFERKQ